MKISDWLGIQHGRGTAMAECFGITLGAISQWKRTGVPVEWMKAVRRYTEGAVDLDDMLPDPPRDFGIAQPPRLHWMVARRLAAEAAAAANGSDSTPPEAGPATDRSAPAAASTAAGG